MTTRPGGAETVVQRSIALIFLTVVVVAIAGVIIWNRGQVTRVPADGANAVGIEVMGSPRFVGREVCGRCHEQNFHFHAESGHATTLRVASDPAILEKFLGSTFDAGEPFGTYQYLVEPGGLAATSEKHGARSFPLEFAFGSGHNAITLATLVRDLNSKTIGMEHRASWFAATRQLGQTPGQRSDPPEFAAEVFGFKKTSEEIEKCIGCHSTTADFSEKSLTVKNLRPNVNCERCHGPGSRHVREAEENPTSPPAFSVGRSDWTANDEITLCGSCHRMPGEFSAPTLREYASVMARFQPVGLLRSECYLESDDVRCTTCHNPHQSSTVQSRQEYENICINCHQQESPEHVSCPQSPSGRCIECHMPRVKFIGGISFHDHWIRVRDPDDETVLIPEVASE